MNILADSGILGTNATLTTDLTLLAYILLIVPGMLVGFVFARRKMFEPYHKYTMTAITLVNWGLIAFVMVVSYSDYVADYVQDDPSNSYYYLPTIHLIFGAGAQLLGTYLLIRMWFEKVLPQWVMVKKIKRYMRFTLGLWLVTALLGTSIYLRWYTSALDVLDTTEDAEPIVTPEPGEPGDINGTLEPGATGEPGDINGTPEPGATGEPGDINGTPEPSATGEPSDINGTLEPASTGEPTENPAATGEPTDLEATVEPAD